MFVTLVFNKKRVKTNYLHYIFFFWVVIYVFNLLMVQLVNINLEVIALVSKLLIPVFLYLYFRINIKNILELKYFLITILMSFIPSVFVFMYDAFLGGQFYSARGVIRMDTEYADVASLGQIATVALIISSYLYLSSIEQKNNKFLFIFIVVSLIGFSTILLIAHASSTAIFFLTFILFLTFLLKSKIVQFIILATVLVIPMYFTFQTEINNYYEIMFEKEFNTIQEEGGLLTSDNAMRGRTGRWNRMLAVYSDQNIVVQLIGGTGIVYPEMIGHGPHNDYLRILFASGIVGLSLYVLFWIVLLLLSFRYRDSRLFLIIATSFQVLLLSISLTPSSYVDLNFFVMAVLAVFVKQLK
jgi:O-antigen ligase